ncbi:Phenol 2-monooxygenase [Mycena venus]|uniref:Phenol 2-monooxygenase n=1 Tax=Mycena venus TaxID=2733690 RepID=A0A8H7CG51_9AGAR|nr:Phenol 2-monooxygenase [Mycena venus]
MTPSMQNSSNFRTEFGTPDTVHPVLIAGAGPAGSLFALCLAKLGVRPLIVDSNHFTDHEWGRGDALLCRTVEVLRSLGMDEAIIANGRPVPERAYWDMTANPPACKTLSDFFPAELDVEDLYALTIRQGLVEKILTDAVTATCGATVLRPWTLVDVRLDEEHPERNPVIVTLKSQYGEHKNIKARYVVGCDGGRSTVRQALHKYGLRLEGDAHDSVWSAIDVLGFETDFPDIQKVTVVASAHGTIMLIPREEIHGRNCLRIYCELDRGGNPTLQDVIVTIHRVFRPYKFSWDEINWFTIYRVAQRVASSFDVKERIFLVGDSAHLHSPKGALGMNTSLIDAHNLAIKIALVETGVARSLVLSTYTLERRQVATQLMQMDAQLIRLHAEHGKSENPEDIKKLDSFNRDHAAFQAGTNITYAPNHMVDDVARVPSPMLNLVGGEGLIVGRRLLPASVRRYSDGWTCKILNAAPCDGRFTIFVCFGRLTSAKAEQLATLREAVFRQDGIWTRLEKRSPFGASSVLRVVGITTTSHLSFEGAALSQGTYLGLRPPGAGKPSLFEISSLYCDDVPCLSPYVNHASSPTRTSAGDLLSVKAAEGILLHPLHQKWDIDIESGGIVVVRPDGHVGVLTRGTDEAAWMKMERYFAQFLML